ncbi:MAG: hypothetical protein OXC09_02895, partial [Truepera sp.]|nr:hypothetical protein [Truepera sp.]
VIEKSGSWYSIDGERLAQGREKTALALEQDPQLKEGIKQRVLSIVRGKAERAGQLGHDEEEVPS